MIESTMKEGVAVLAMRHGKANALDIELCQALCGALDDAAAEGAAAVVLTGAGQVFSAGVDLKRVTAGREEYVAAFLPELRRAFTIGFLVFLPFLVVDLLTANVLLALGLSQLSPTSVALPFKLLLFVAVDGWKLIARGLVLGYLADPF